MRNYYNADKICTNFKYLLKVSKITPVQLLNFRNQHNQNSEEKMYSTMEQDLIFEEKKLASNAFKQKWLTMTLNFIKDDNQHVLVYPEMPFEEMDFVESLIIHKYNINLGAELKPLFASIEEAITIFQLKYDFTLKSVVKGDKTV